VTDFVDELLAPRGGALRPSVRDELSLALRELLLNAIEHGNLGLGFEDKSRALAAGRWKQIVVARAREAAYRKRRTRVTADWSPERVSFTIRDEGSGFDWRSLPDPSDPDNILCDHGRGVLMARLSVDALYFNATGNEVTIVKNLGDGPAGAADGSAGDPPSAGRTHVARVRTRC
jgi:anti-sigma regulatory factor (Ser/Thr protein kinase)